MREIEMVLKCPASQEKMANLLVRKSTDSDKKVVKVVLLKVKRTNLLEPIWSSQGCFTRRSTTRQDCETEIDLAYPVAEKALDYLSILYFLQLNIAIVTVFNCSSINKPDQRTRKLGLHLWMLPKFTENCQSVMAPIV